MVAADNFVRYNLVWLAWNQDFDLPTVVATIVVAHHTEFVAADGLSMAVALAVADLHPVDFVAKATAR
jgi:hypothetical protein